MTTKTATFYVTLHAERSPYRHTPISRVKAVALRQSKGGVGADEIVVKVSVVVPDSAFEPFELPAVTLNVTPAELTAMIEEAA